jgi:hypothetical protein
LVSIAAAGDHMVALRNDGQVVAWGANNFGQTNVPPSMTNITGIEGTVWNSVGVKPDGSVLVWGSNETQQTNVPVPLSNVVSVTGGWYDLMALKSDGTVVSWGLDNALPAGLTNVAFIGSGDYNTFAIAPDLPPIAVSTNVAGYVNATVVLTLAARDPNGDLLTRRIASLPNRGTCFQYESGSPGTPIVTTNSAVLDPLGRVFFLPEPNAWGNPFDTFSFVANDGELDSAPATISVRINLPTRPKLKQSFGFATNGAFTLRFDGSIGAAYRVWVSTNLSNWEPLGAAEPLGSGLFQFLDLNATNHGQRFYKVSAP